MFKIYLRIRIRTVWHHMCAPLHKFTSYCECRMLCCVYIRIYGTVYLSTSIGVRRNVLYRERPNGCQSRANRSDKKQQESSVGCASRVWGSDRKPYRLVQSRRRKPINILPFPFRRLCLYICIYICLLFIHELGVQKSENNRAMVDVILLGRRFV